MKSVPTLTIPVPRDLLQAGMSPQEVCAWGYFAAVQRRCEQICLLYPGGWERIYPLSDVRAMLMGTPDLHGEVRMGRRRALTVRENE